MSYKLCNFVKTFAPFIGRRSISTNVFTDSKLPPSFVDPKVIEEKLNNVGYFVERTKVGKNLPVYLETHNKGKHVFTLIRHVYGDFKELKREIESVCKVEKRIPTEHRKGRASLPVIESIQIKKDMNQIKVLGDHLLVLKNHLTNKGF